MAVIAIHRGHCFRTSGATGGRDEQRLANEVGTRLQLGLVRLGHKVHLLSADQAVPGGLDVFVALHTDGVAKTATVDPQRKHGASVGYNTAGGAKLAAAWKRHHQLAGFRWGFLPDNYTAGLRGYYGFGRSDARFEFLAEHGMHSNNEEHAWMHSNYDLLARTHIAAIGEMVGHPKPPGDVVSDPTPTSTAVSATIVFSPDGGMGAFTVDALGGVFTEGVAVYRGSLPEMGVRPNGPIIGIIAWGTEGYTLLGADGGVYNFGSAPAILPYSPLFEQYRAGARRIVDAFGLGSSIITVSNLGERYNLSA